MCVVGFFLFFFGGGGLCVCVCVCVLCVCVCVCVCCVIFKMSNIYIYTNAHTSLEINIFYVLDSNQFVPDIKKIVTTLYWTMTVTSHLFQGSICCCF